MSARRFYGPRLASWFVSWSDRPRYSGASYSARTNAMGDVAYFHAENRDAAAMVTRTEFCPVPGCDGHGTISVRTRRGAKDRDCAQCAESPAVETIDYAEVRS